MSNNSDKVLRLKERIGQFRHAREELLAGKLSSKTSSDVTDAVNSVILIRDRGYSSGLTEVDFSEL